MFVQPSSNSIAAGRSPGRLHTKTSDLSDILHGRITSSSKPSGLDIPPVPLTPLTTPTLKPKGKLARFLARRRKSGGVALSSGHDASVKEEDGADTEHYPAIPQSLAASRIPSANQPSLPPLNASPTSSFTSATETAQSSRLSADPGSLLSAAASSSTTQHRSTIPCHDVKSQSSTSFEVSRPLNVTHTATATNLAMVNGSTSRIPSVEPKSKSVTGKGTPSKKPTITISAPPSTEDIEDDKHVFNSPRAAPAPLSFIFSSLTPAKTSQASRGTHGVARKLSFGHHKKGMEELSMMSNPEGSAKSKEQSLPVTSPAPSVSPLLPSKMHFPLPPRSTLSRDAQLVPTLTDAFQPLSLTSHSIATVSPHTATASDMSDGGPSPSSNVGMRTTPSSPARLSSSVSRSRANSANTISSTLTAKLPPSSPSSPILTHDRPVFPHSSRIRDASTLGTSVNASGNRVLTQHYSYSARSTNSTAIAPSPTSPPPMSPLPPPPSINETSFSGSASVLSSSEEVEVEDGWSTDASTRLGHGWWSTDASTRVELFGGSLTNMEKAVLLGAGESRIRANTISTTASATTANANSTNGHSTTYQRASTSSRLQHPHHPTLASTYRKRASGVSSGEETNYESAASGRSILAGRKKAVEVLSSKVNSSKDSRRPRSASQSSAQQDLPPLPASTGCHDSSNSTAPTKEESNVSSSGLRVAHQIVRILEANLTHVTERAELLLYTERLRQIVCKLEEESTAGRLRSGSKSSDFSGISGISAGKGSDTTTRSRTSSGVDRSADPTALISPADSTEEGLMELQSEVSDFIAPAQGCSRAASNAYPINSQSRGSEDQSDPRRDSSVVGESTSVEYCPGS